MNPSESGLNRLNRLWLPLLLSLGGYGVLAVMFPLFPYFNRSPLLDINRFLTAPLSILGYALLFVALYYLYWRLCQMVKRLEQGVSLGLIMLTGLLLALPLIVTFPVNSTDIYRYYIRGRITTVHHESPYLVSPAELGEAEPYAVLAGEWAGKTTPYGPVWEIFAAGVAVISPDNLLLALILLKGLALLFHLTIGGLIWLSLKGRTAAFQASRTALWVWNPALLLIFVVDGHNDALMLLWLVLGWWLMTRQRWQLAMLIMVLAPLSKLIGLLAPPFFFLAALRRMEGLAAKVRFFVITAVGWLALIWLFFLPFGPPLSLVRRLLDEAGSGGEFSFLALIFLIGRDLFGAGITLESIELATRIAAGLFLLLFLWLLWRTLHGRSPLRSTADTFFGYVVQSFVFRIWYTAWNFPWLLLDDSEEETADDTVDDSPFFSIRRLKTAEGRMYTGFWFLFTAQLSVLIYGTLRTSLLAGQHVYAHLTGIPFTFLLPLILASISLNKYSRKAAKAQSGSERV